MRLTGITRKGHVPCRNPDGHAPAFIQNRIILEKHSSDGAPVRRVHDGNIMTTDGLNNLAELLVTGNVSFSNTNSWINIMAVGTSTTAAASGDTNLYNSTASVHVSDASMTRSDAGDRTLQFNATFDDSNAYALNEVGLFGTSTANGQLQARTMLGTDSVNKGTGDTVNISYQVIFTTA